MSETIVLAFSGGLDTSWCIPWLTEHHDAEIVTVTVDVGGLGEQASEQLEARSRLLGASRHVHVDARQLFFDEVLRFLIMGHVRKGGSYPLCVGAERTLQAREVARIATEMGATAVAHGCTAAGNDQVRFEIALRVLAPNLQILAPIRDQAPSRQEEVAFLEARGFPVPAHGALYSVNSGLWGVTIGGAETTGTRDGLPERAWVRTRGAFDDPREPELLHLGFERGLPVFLNHERMDPVALIEGLDSIAASFGIGRGMHLGDTILGFKGRVAFEAPAAEVLLLAHRELEKLVLTASQMRVKDSLAATYGDLIHEGRHLDPAARDIEALFNSSQLRVSGDVNLRLRPGMAFVEGVTSKHSIHAACGSIYGEEAHDWSPDDARGFTRIAALPLVLQSRAEAKA
ncbi:MAG: argininosuccinate synthase [Planctomycetes bacterium]|nr:argininosuccinate synthase [Planctomycetota bacterium]